MGRRIRDLSDRELDRQEGLLVKHLDEQLRWPIGVSEWRERVRMTRTLEAVRAEVKRRSDERQADR